MDLATTISNVLRILRVPKERREAVGGKLYIGALMAVMRHAPPPVAVDFGEETDEEIDGALRQIAVYLREDRKANKAATDYFRRLLMPLQPNLTERQREQLDQTLFRK